MIKNILIYLAILSSAFIFNIFYYAWFSWFLLVLTICIPFVSLVFSLPFMISCAVNGIVVFSHEKINIGDDFVLGISSKRKHSILCPQMRINIKTVNSFAKHKQTLKIRLGGYYKKPILQKFNKLSKNCGQVHLDAKFCKIYDMTGIFCIPIKIDCHIICDVMPKTKKPELLPDCDLISVVGYKPKSGGGFSDFYELRQYQKGDSLKNIHWKLSSKQDDLIVREPSIPIYRQFAVKLDFSDDISSNNDILARFIYACKYILKKGSVCYAFCKNAEFISAITSTSELNEFIKSIYIDSEFQRTVFERSDTLIYTISKSGEEVSEI